MQRSVRLVGLAAVVALLFVAPATAHGNHVEADPQVSADGTVVVEEAFGLSDGFVVIYADDGGDLGRRLGHAPVAAGRNTGVEVRLDGEAWERLGDAATVHVQLHADDGDGAFEPEQDAPAVWQAAVARDTFRVARGDAANVVWPHTGWHRTARPEVSVRRATLPSSGHLVIRTDESVDDGRVLGSRALDPGVHRNVTVDVNRTYFRAQEFSFDVRAVVYRDDGDGAFDASDEPVQAAGRPVATRFGVELAANDSTTASPTGNEATTPATADGGSDSLVNTQEANRTYATPTTTRTGGQPGFGAAAAVLAVVAAAALGAGLLRRRR